MTKAASTRAYCGTVLCALLGRATGASEAIALAKWLARRVVNPAQPSAAGYPPVFYAVALREYELMHILVRPPRHAPAELSYLNNTTGIVLQHIRWLSAP
jgi:hypothetical protein